MPSKPPEPTWDADTDEWVLAYATPLRYSVEFVALAMAISYGHPPVQYDPDGSSRLAVFGRQGALIGRGHIRPAVTRLAEIRVHDDDEPNPGVEAVQAWCDVLERDWLPDQS